MLVCLSVHHIFEFRAVLASLLLPNYPRLDCRVSSLVSVISGIVFLPTKRIKNDNELLSVLVGIPSLAVSLEPGSTVMPKGIKNGIDD